MPFKIKKYFRKTYPHSDVLFTNSGRAALQAVIEDFKLENSEMILPSFICSDVFSPLLIQNSIRPILVDCPKKSFNIRFSDIIKKYKKGRTKAILIVHTFGQINKDILKISRWCKQKNLLLIEDCAHCINLTYNGKPVGSIADASIFSFPKILKTSFGGAYLRNKGRIRITPKRYRPNILDLYRILNKTPYGKEIINLLRRLKLKNKIKVNPSKIKILSPNLLFDFFPHPFNQIDIKKRRKISTLFFNELRKDISLFKLDLKNNFFYCVPILLRDEKRRDKIFRIFIDKKIDCRKIWTDPLSNDSFLLKKYNLKRTPNAELFSKKIVNILIDSNYTKEDILKKTKIVSEIIKKYN